MYSVPSVVQNSSSTQVPDSLDSWFHPLPHPLTHPLKTLLILLFTLSTVLAFELKDGESVAFLGDTLIEREQYHGWIELALTTRFPDREIKFRNLGWSADTPAGESRNGLSLLQAGLEPPEEGWRQLLAQLETYKPNVIILGYGMASSLPGGDSPEEFEKNLTRLLDEAPKATGQDVRFLILGPPPRFPKNFDTRNELEKHQAKLSATDAILEQNAKTRKIPYISLNTLEKKPEYSQNGIHLTSDGYLATARLIEKSLGWPAGQWEQGDAATSLRQHIIRKNEWFFNRSRPANMAYIFGFRKKEQGQNAMEIPRFDQLVIAEESEIANLRSLPAGVTTTPLPEQTASEVASNTPQPHPDFTVAEGFEITLWAENPMIHKPTQINFDPQGRLWVASSQTYPQIEVGQTPDDKIFILEDTDGDGKADSSKVFADGLFMPTAVLPGDGGAYVAQSTDLFHYQDTDGDGKSDKRTRVLSGFGTEDTHHNLHTLRRGPDGRIWMHQSVYTRSDVETPHGIVRLKSGGSFRFDPRNLHLETVFRGIWNPWGHQFDEFGQSFLTDGAGFNGITWGIPGATYAAYANAENILAGISPGTYPKFCGLEIIGSDIFPEDWQRNLITCDFRAHRIVRFSIADDGSGYVTQEHDDLIRSNSVNFRPIDVKTGPDGALYVADWANPIINHGEVDFRDPRRDREHGRIWRIAPKGTQPTKPNDLTKLPEPELLAAFSSEDRYLREQATAILFDKNAGNLPTLKDPKTDAELLAALHLSIIRGDLSLPLIEKAYASEKGEVRAAAIRQLAEILPETNASEILTSAISDPFPRVRLEAIRTLAEIPGYESLDLALTALDLSTDRFIEHALWHSVRASGTAYLESLDGKSSPDPKKLEFVLASLPAEKASETVSRLFPDTLPADGSGPWLTLGLKTGDNQVLASIYGQALKSFDAPTRKKALIGLAAAISRNPKQPALNTDSLLPFLEKGDPAALQLASAIASDNLLPALAKLTKNPSENTRLAAINTLASFPSPAAREILLPLTTENQPPSIRTAAAFALARHHRTAALPVIAELAAGLTEPEAALSFWRDTLSQKGISSEIAAVFGKSPLPESAAALALRSVPDNAAHDPLLKILRLQSGVKNTTEDTATRIKKISAMVGAADPYKGELIYRRPALACTSCHAIAGVGGTSGPDLTSIGASAPLDYLIESILDPGSKVKEGYHSVVIETTDGRALSGQILRSSGGTTVIRDATGKETALPDRLIAKQTDIGSLMPSGLIDSLNPRATADLVRFLSELGKPGDFSANDSNSPKIYAITARDNKTMDAAMKGEKSVPWNIVNATVNGRLFPNDVYAAKPEGGNPLIGTKIQLATPATLTLTFAKPFQPAELHINGKPASSGTVELPAGIHTIVFRPDKLDGPIRLSANTGTFLPTW